jgi:hypothetical protein
MARLLPDPPSRTGGILTKRELDAALRVLSSLRQSQPATVVLSWDNDMQDILQGLGRARYVETLPAYGGRNPKSSAPFKPDIMKTTPLGLEYLESIQAAQSASPARHHATKKSPAQLDREIATALAQQSGKGDRYYVAHPDEVAEVTIVLRGRGNYNVKRRYKKPVRVRNVSDGDEFFVEESEIFRDPGAAGAHSAELARKALGVQGNHSSRQHSTRHGAKISAAALKAKARALQALGAAAPKRSVLAVDQQLRRVLNGIDPFWVRWSAFIDGEGGGRIGTSWRNLTKS